MNTLLQAVQSVQTTHHHDLTDTIWFKVKQSGNKLAEDILLLNAPFENTRIESADQAQQAAVYWAEAVREAYQGDFIVRVWVKGQEVPIDYPYIYWSEQEETEVSECN